MPLYKLGEIAPRVAASAYVAPNATVLGNIVLAERASVWFAATLRGDNEQINIGESSNVAHAEPRRVRELNALIDGFLKDTDAVVPVRNPGYGKAVAEAGDPLQGWKARQCEAVIRDGIVTVTPTARGVEPFLGVAPGARGPSVVTFRVRGKKGGAGKVEWLKPAGDGKAGSPRSVPFTVEPGEWQSVSVAIPEQGPLGIVRLYLPAQQQAVELDWVELKGAGSSRRWDF